MTSPNITLCEDVYLEHEKKRKQRKVKGEAIRNVRKKIEIERSGTKDASCSDEATVAKISMLSVVAVE